MGLIISIVIGLISAFILGVLPLKLAAKWLKAGNSSWKAIILVLLSTWLITIAAQIIIGLSVSLLPLLGIVVAIPVLIGTIYYVFKMYSRFLDTSFWRGVGIAFFSWFISVVITAILTGILMVIFGAGAVSAVALGVINHKNTITPQVIMDSYDQQKGSQKRRNRNMPELINPTTQPNEAQKSDTETKNKEDKKQEKNNTSYHNIEIEKAAKHIGEEAKVNIIGGKYFEGILVNVDRKQGILSFEKEVHNGTMQVHIPFINVEQLEILY